MGSLRDEDIGAPVLGGHQAGGGIAAVDAKPPASAVDVGVYGVLGDAELACDLLRRQVPVYELKAFPFTRAQHIQVVIRRWIGHMTYAFAQRVGLNPPLAKLNAKPVV